MSALGTKRRVKLDRYEDLLRVRAMPDYHFVADDEVEVDVRHWDDATVDIEAGELADFLFDYQRWIVEMALDRERFAVFSTTGTGKTAIQLEWARLVTDMHNGRSLVVAPLAVVPQTVREAEAFYGDGLKVADLRERSALEAWLEVGSGIGITNYEKIDRIASRLAVDAVVLDESSVLKNNMGQRRTSLIRAFKGVRWKLCCSATPAPNDRVEYAEHAFFLDQVRSTREFLAAFFVNRDGNWELKRHGLESFYRHLASWSVFMLDPKAFRFDHDADLPPLDIEYPAVPATVEQMERSRSYESGDQASMFGINVGGVTSRIKMAQIANGFVLDDGKVAARFPARKPEVVAELCELYGDEQVIVWVTFDEEGDHLERLIPDAVHLSGRTPRARRDEIINRFRSGERCVCQVSPNTCAPTTEPTQTSGNALPSRMSAATLDAGSDTRLTSGTASARSSRVSSSRPTSTSPSSKRKAASARSVVADPGAATGATDSRSTTTTPQEEFAASCADTATSASATLEMIPKDSKRRPCTCGGAPRVLLLKPQQFSFGLNLQACRVQVFSSITDSWERLFQCIRRSWRYGQTRPVKVYVPLTPFDDAVASNLAGKQSVYDHDAERMQAAFVAALRPVDLTERRHYMTSPTAEIDRAESETWTLVHGDCIAHMPTMLEHSMDFAVFSPPFANLFTYSAALGDMGNVRTDAEYRLQWRWFAEQLVRVMKPGRNVAVHCMDVIRFAGSHGIRHTYDYPADLAAGMRDAGFLYRARIAIDKDPQVQATRTKDANLLFVTLKRDALDSHPQASECVLLFTAPGENETPVHAIDVSNREWIEWAHHVWYGIRETDVLNAALGKEHEDERHICPLQLPLIERCVRLWTNPGESVFSPFAGIGSEGVRSIEWGRRFYGIELKESYYRTAARNLRDAETRAGSKLAFA